MNSPYLCFRNHCIPLAEKLLMQNKLKKAILILSLVIVNHAFGEYNYSNLHSLKFSTINQKNGLASNNVECIFKDSDGFMWFGTRNGLSRFDGYEIITYNSTDGKNSISGNRILCIAEDSDHYLWVGTYNNGANRFDTNNETFEHYGSENSIGDRVNSIKILSDNSIWICSNTGLATYHKETNSFEAIAINPNDPNALPSGVVYDLYESKSGELYVTCENENIFQFNRSNGSFTPIKYTRDSELITNYNKQIIEDKNGNLWIAANFHGLCSYNPTTKESDIYQKGNKQLNTNLLTGDISVDPYGNIWICTDGFGMNIMNPITKQFQYLEAEPKTNHLTTNTYYTAYFDEKNRIWLGSFDEGVFCYDQQKEKFKSTLYHPNDLDFFKGKSIISAFQDSRNVIWIGTDGNGLYQIDTKGKIKAFQYNADHPNSSISSNVITALAEDKKGRILIGTYLGGLNILNTTNGLIEHYLQKPTAGDQINSTSVWNICQDSQHKIWLGLLADGLALFDQDKMTFQNRGPSSNSPQKVNFPNVMTIMEDSDGDIWYGTEGKGIFILDHQSDRIIKPIDDSIRHISSQGIIKCFFQDRWENIWIGTEGKGLFKYNKSTKEFTQLSVANGLASNIVQSIIEDQNGNLWIGTANGLSFLNSNQLEFKNYIESDGLSGNEFNQNVSIQLNDSRILMGTSNGVDVFNANDIVLNQDIPDLVFTKLIVQNIEMHPGTMVNNKVILAKNINKTDQIRLTNKEKTFSLEFAALNYTQTEKCQYAYMLEGFDEDWNFTDAMHRTASYSNLPPKTYTFKVKASNNDGFWGDNLRSIVIVVLPPFHKTLLFRSIMVILVLAIAYFAYRYRLNILKNRFMQKQIEQERKIMMLEKEQLDAELKKMTFHILNRNRALIDQKNRLLGLSSKAKESVRNGLQEIIHQFDEELTDDKDWKYIEPQLDKVYDNFVSKLKELHPDLTLTEIKIAAYVRMNLTTKEIMEFMHKTSRAVENDRYRLRKKIGLNNNDSLQQYLMKI